MTKNCMDGGWKQAPMPWKCAAAGNDIIMPGSRRDDENIRRAYEDGILSEESIRACAGRIVELVRRLTG